MPCSSYPPDATDVAGNWHSPFPLTTWRPYPDASFLGSVDSDSSDLVCKTESKVTFQPLPTNSSPGEATRIRVTRLGENGAGTICSASCYEVSDHGLRYSLVR